MLFSTSIHTKPIISKTEKACWRGLLRTLLVVCASAVPGASSFAEAVTTARAVLGASACAQAFTSTRAVLSASAFASAPQLTFAVLRGNLAGRLDLGWILGFTSRCQPQSKDRREQNQMTHLRYHGAFPFLAVPFVTQGLMARCPEHEPGQQGHMVLPASALTSAAALA